MASKTPNLQLNKINLSDSPPDIEVLNPNWDKLDSEIKTIKDNAAAHSADYASKIQTYGINYDNTPWVTVSTETENVEILRIPSRRFGLGGVVMIGFRISSHIGFKTIQLFKRASEPIISSELAYSKSSNTVDNAVVSLSEDYRTANDYDVIVRLTNNHTINNCTVQAVFFGSNANI